MAEPPPHVAEVLMPRSSTLLPGMEDLPPGQRGKYGERYVEKGGKISGKGWEKDTEHVGKMWER